jgi:hypothetical protein
VGLPRGGVIDESPFAAVVVVADDKVKGCEHGREKSLELQESMTPVGGPVGGSERGPLGLGREGEGLVLRHSGSAQVELASLDLRAKKKKKDFWNTLIPFNPPLYPSSANWESLMRVGPTRLGAALDAGGRSGPRWTGDAWLARRRRYSTARRDRAIA